MNFTFNFICLQKYNYLRFSGHLVCTLCLHVGAICKWCLHSQNLSWAILWREFLIMGKKSAFLVSRSIKTQFSICHKKSYYCRALQIRHICLMWENIKAFSLFSFNFYRYDVELFTHGFYFLCSTLGRSQSFPWRSCFAMLFSGKFCKWIQNLMIDVSVKSNFSANIPSSFLAPATPRASLFAKENMRFFKFVSNPEVKIIFIINVPAGFRAI